MKDYIKTAVAAAQNAGKMLLKEYENFDRSQVSFKSAHEILTKADLKSEEAIIKEIQKSFPFHGLLSEEKGAINLKDKRFHWIIDPLDGTTNFSIRNPLWSISIAGVDPEGTIVLGLVYAPVLDEMYIAIKGQGAELNGKKIRVSETAKGGELHTFCHGKKEKDIKKALEYYRKQKLGGFDCRQLGSAALELAYVAAGRIESITIPGANSWDVAAGALLAEEAGGIVTDFKGHDWNLKSPDILASNGKGHRQLLRVMTGK